MSATWKRILTTEDGNIGSKNLTISGSTARTLTLETATGQATTLSVDHNPDSASSYSILSVIAGQDGSDDLTNGVVVQGGLTIIGNLDGSTGAGSLILKESGSSQDNFTSLRCGPMSTNILMTLPTDGPTSNGQVLAGTVPSSGEVTLSWVDNGSGGGSIDGSGAADRMAYWSDADTLTFNNKFEVDDSTGQVTLGALVAQTTKGSGAVTGDSGNFFRITIGAGTGSTIGDTGGGARFFSKFGTGTVTAGKVHYKTSTNTWATAANDDLTEASSLLAVADSSASSQLMLKEGAVKMASNQGFSTASRGAPLYLASVGGAVTSTVPAAGSNPVYVRIVGYVIDASNAIIYFDPDKSWVEI